MTAPQLPAHVEITGTIPGVIGYTITELRELWERMTAGGSGYDLVTKRLACMAVDLANQLARREVAPARPGNSAHWWAIGEDVTAAIASSGTSPDTVAVRARWRPASGDDAAAAEIHGLCDALDAARVEIERLGADWDIANEKAAGLRDRAEKEYARAERAEAAIIRIRKRCDDRADGGAGFDQPLTVAEIRAALDGVPTELGATERTSKTEAASVGACCESADTIARVQAEAAERAADLDRYQVAWIRVRALCNASHACRRCPMPSGAMCDICEVRAALDGNLS